MLDTLPSELLHRIIIYASPLISLSATPLGSIATEPEQYFETSPPSLIPTLALTCSALYKVVKFTDNAWLFSKIFERTFDFDAARRRLGIQWAGAHGLAWEGRKRWAMIQRMKKAAMSWENGHHTDGHHSFRWIDEYGEEDIRADLWTIYLMLLENDGKNAILLTLGAKLGQIVEMLCRLYFGRRVTRRVGWPISNQERALLAWILVALDPLPSDFADQDLYHQTKLCMRAFIFASFKYSLGILPPTYFIHPSSLDPSHYQHQVPATALLPYPLNPISSVRYASWTPPPDPPTYKYSNDHLAAIIIYAHTVHLYPPSLAVAALLWYFRGTNAIVSAQVTGSPQEYSEWEDESPTQVLSNLRRQISGTDTPSSATSTPTEPSSSNSHPSSATRSFFGSLRADPNSWVTPLLFSTPLSPPTIPQSTYNRAFRNELYRRKFNAASRQLDQEWTRRLEGHMRFGGPSRVEGFVPGSLEGTWEGGFLYLDFPDYTQFLTGEKEATPDFYQLPPDKVYGSNRQVWKLKEYELQTFSDGSENSPSTSEQLTTRNRYGSPSYIHQPLASSGAMGLDASLTSASNSSQPLSVGRWMDGWLPPSDTLKWQYPDDGDELEIVEVIKANPLAEGNTSAGRKPKASKGLDPDEQDKTPALAPVDTRVVVTASEEDGDETEEGWQKEKAGVAGKIRGRTSARKSNHPAALEFQSQTSSTTPVARPPVALPEESLRPLSILSPTSSRSYAPPSASSTVYSNLDARTLSPPTSPPVSRSLSPPVKGDNKLSKRFSWGWKNRDKKEKKSSKEPNGGQQQAQHEPLIQSQAENTSYNTDQRHRREATDSTQDSQPIASTRQATFDSIDAQNLDSQSDREDLSKKGKKEPEVVERVSRYVRWDPNVAWAKQAIWGPRDTGGSVESSQQGNVRGMTVSTNTTVSSAPSSVKASAGLSKSGSGVSGISRGQRQVRDILVFGESHSSWGEATIRGRIRSHDGLITLVKTYPQRATWIYTGYVIGGESFVGRWRDANSPEEVNGYEGPFAMKRRR